MELKCTHKDDGYEWDTESKMLNITCPNCGRKVNREEARKLFKETHKGE